MVIGNRLDNIKNELAYFYKVIKNMDLQASIKRSKIHKYQLKKLCMTNF